MGNAGTGFVAASIAALGFGSNFIPVKQYNMGNGMMFQMIMAIGIWMFGLFYTIIRSIVLDRGPWIHPFAMLGGLIWNTGNILTVPIIKCVGMALGLAIWSGTSMLVGWATGKWGLLGTPKDDSVKIQWLNYFGLALVLSSLVLFFNVKPNNSSNNNNNNNYDQDHDHDHDAENGEYSNNGNSNNYNHKTNIHRPLPVNANNFLTSRDNTTARRDDEHDVDTDVVIKNDKYHYTNLNRGENDSLRNYDKPDHGLHPLLQSSMESESWENKLEPWQRQTLGVILSLFAGVCYGTCFCPVQYTINSHKDNRTDYPSHLNDYTFSHFTGILLTSIVYFCTYALITKNYPQPISHDALLPSIICGFVWGLAQVCFFIAVTMLGTQTAFPVVSGSPQVIASLWGVLLFKEVTGRRNLMMLSFAIFVACSAIGCIAISKT